MLGVSVSVRVGEVGDVRGYDVRLKVACMVVAEVVWEVDAVVVAEVVEIVVVARFSDAAGAGAGAWMVGARGWPGAGGGAVVTTESGTVLSGAADGASGAVGVEKTSSTKASPRASSACPVAACPARPQRLSVSRGSVSTSYRRWGLKYLYLPTKTPTLERLYQYSGFASGRCIGVESPTRTDDRSIPSSVSPSGRADPGIPDGANWTQHWFERSSQHAMHVLTKIAHGPLRGRGMATSPTPTMVQVKPKDAWVSTKHAWGVPSMHGEYQACMGQYQVKFERQATDERSDTWQHVDKRDGRVGVDAVGRHPARPTNDERHPDTALTFVVLPARERPRIAEEGASLWTARVDPDWRRAVIRGQDGNGVVGQAELVEPVQQPPDHEIEAEELGQVLPEPVIRVGEPEPRKSGTASRSHECMQMPLNIR